MTQIERQADRASYGAPLINHLRWLASTANDLSESRAALAELRRGLDDPLRIARHVAPYLPDGRISEEREEWYYTIAALFAYHQYHKRGFSLGTAFRKIKDDSGSIESRFLALISAKPEQLANHLRHAVRLLASRGVPLDWYRLTEAVVNWDDAHKRPQRELARDFYRSAAVPAVDAAGAADTAESAE